MKKLILTLVLILTMISLYSQTQLAPYKATQVVYTNGTPNDTTFNPEAKGIKSYSEVAYDFTNKKLYTWNRTTNKWVIANSTVLSDSLSATFNTVIDSVNSIVDTSLLASNSLTLIDSGSVSTGKFINGKEIFVFYNAIPGPDTVGNNGGWSKHFGYLPNNARVLNIETTGDIFIGGSKLQFSNNFMGVSNQNYIPALKVINYGIGSVQRSVSWGYAVSAGAIVTDFAVKVYYFIP